MELERRVPAVAFDLECSATISMEAWAVIGWVGSFVDGDVVIVENCQVAGMA